MKIDDNSPKDLFSWTTGRDGKPNTALQFKGNYEGFNPGINISPKSIPGFTFTAWAYGRPEGFLFGTTLPRDEVYKIISRNLYFDGKCVEATYMTYNSRSKKDNSSLLRSSSLPDDEWNFVAVSMNAKDSSLVLFAGEETYRVADHDVLIKVFHTGKGGDLIIGNSYSPYANNRFKGKVADIRVYNRALTVDEISAVSGIKFVDASVRIGREDTIKKWALFALFLFYVVSIIYMIVLFFFKEKKYKPVTEKDLVQYIDNAKSSPDSSASNELAQKYLDDVFNTWTQTEQNDQGVFRSPTKKKHFTDTLEALEKARALKPSEKNIVDRMNELGGIYNHLSKRKFYGNWALAGAALILPIIFLIIERNNMIATNINGFIVMVLPTIAYVLANFAPTYVVAGRKGRINKLFGGIFAVVLGAGSTVLATEYYDHITWSDGSKTVEYNTEQNMASGFIGIIILIIALLLAMFLVGLSAIISFFRNYVFYI
jgi:hypothetical protein